SNYALMLEAYQFYYRLEDRICRPIAHSGLVTAGITTSSRSRPLSCTQKLRFVSNSPRSTASPPLSHWSY
ncbi:MAG TPA: hypothetical protein VEP90_13455, partial [Methylomirabilota bacterium]|nr:hypothetical protein [Methylomirabilota bacterium]